MGSRWRLALLFVLFGYLSAAFLSGVAAQESNRAAVVVRFAEGHSESRCVAFEEEQISGFELLNRSGLPVDARIEGMGGIVCRIGETGCSQNDCFCQCKGGADCTYWSYWHARDADWRYAQVGASTYLVGNGEVDGWSWGPGSPDSAIAPPPGSFEEICKANAQNTSESGVDSANSPNWMGYAALAVLLIVLGSGVVLINRNKRDPVQ
jgi:hypothetical protein